MKTKLLFEEDQRLRSVLVVPYYPQPDDSQYCVPYSIKMVHEYYRVKYQGGAFKSVIQEVPVEVIAGAINCRRDAGTTFRTNYGKTLTDLFDPLEVNFSIDELTLEDVKAKFTIGIPVIALYDYLMAYEPKLGIPGPGHASVIVGIDKNSIVLHDPSFNEYTLLGLDVFKAAWKARDNRAILITLKQGIPMHKGHQSYLNLKDGQTVMASDLEIDTNGVDKT